MTVYRASLRNAGAACACLLAVSASAGDWPQWCGTDGKNMVSGETGLPGSFVPGEKRQGVIDLATAKNVAWGVKVCSAAFSTPSVAHGKVFLGGVEAGSGIFACLDAATGSLLWKWKAAPKKFPSQIQGFSLGISVIPPQLGVCSSAAVDSQHVYFVSNRFEVVCLDINGQPAAPPPAGAESGAAKTATTAAREPRVVWLCDMEKQFGVFPCDAADGSPLLDGDLLYVQTSNGIDRNTFRDPAREKQRKFPAPNAPNLIVLDKRTGKLVATDDGQITPNILHGQWSAVSMGQVAGRKLIFFGAGDGRCYAFEALTAIPEKPVQLKTVWSHDCIPPEYKVPGQADPVTHYCLGDRRVVGTLNKHDGTFVGLSEIIATPVFLSDRIYLAIGRDPEHGRGRGAMHCIDATKTGDTTATGRIWAYQGLDRTLSTASVAGGLVYVSDVAGRLHCLDADSGARYWIHETRAETWGSTLVADGKVYMPTASGLDVLKAGKELQLLSHITFGAKVFASPVVANGTLYIATCGGWVWAVREAK